MLTIDANVWVAAADRHDDFHTPSRQFVTKVAAEDLRIVLPSIAQLEIACALARRRRNATTGERLANALLAGGQVTLAPVDNALLNQAIGSGTKLFLRGADALYLAVAQLYGTELITWDDELIQRASALTPNMWLDQNT